MSNTKSVTITPPVKLVRREGDELPQVYRPCSFSELYGPAERGEEMLARTLARNECELPFHVLLISGESGTGKTSLARIIALSMNCHDPQSSKKYDANIEPCLQCKSCSGILERGLLSRHYAFQYHDATSMTKEDILTVIKEDLSSSNTLDGRFKFVVFEGAHKLTKQQREMLLKPMENILTRTYVFFLTTEPEKLTSDATFRSRLTHVSLGKWTEQNLLSLIEDVARQEHERNYPQMDISALKYIVQVSGLNPRKALNDLQLVLESSSDDVVLKKDIEDILK